MAQEYTGASYFVLLLLSTFLIYPVCLHVNTVLPSVDRHSRAPPFLSLVVITVYLCTNLNITNVAILVLVVDICGITIGNSAAVLRTERWLNRP
ncbi:hypothetical protein B0H15DRAFT_483895 [Mycena belliarum]|uniref:Uncharacterized protein n=1 Tax=Mycena belliarum TaxID=1033014 RepID=A0AAD6U0J1_9AGAR|nr:hypothetical protein B0H15DRAFT_483895 [Mycena belliae]